MFRWHDHTTADRTDASDERPATRSSDKTRALVRHQRPFVASSTREEMHAETEMRPAGHAPRNTFVPLLPGERKLRSKTMYKTKILFAAAAVTASAGSLLLTVTPAHARDVTVVASAQDVPTATVRLNDLNLAAASGQRTLSRRVGKAVREVCADRDTRDLQSGYGSCVSEAWTGARPQMASLISRAERMAASATVAVAASSISVRARP